MKRLFGLLVCMIVFSWGASLGQAQDKVTFRERKGKDEKTTVLNGKIEKEDVTGLVISSGAKRTIEVQDIIDVVYEVPGSMQFEAAGAIKAEQAREYDKAIKGYAALIPKLTGGAARHAQYRLAMTLVARTEDDKSKIVEAIKELSDFRSKHADSWQFFTASKALARLNVDKPAADYDTAAKILGELSGNSKLPAPARQEADLLSIDVFMRGKKYSEAKSRIEGVVRNLSNDDPQKVRMEILLIGCAAGDGSDAAVAAAAKQLEERIAKVSDNSLRALAYNTLGDVYSAATSNRKRDAMWAYLWVDVVYSQDKNELIKAVDRLSRLFEEIGETNRAEQYREKLRKLR